MPGKVEFKDHPVSFRTRDTGLFFPDKNILNLKFLFPKMSGEKAVAGRIIFINGDVPQLLVDAPEPIEVSFEAHRGDDHR